MVDAVVFDIGNVLVHWDPRAFYAELIPDQAELDWFMTNVVTLEWHTHHDRGRPFADGVAELSARYPNYASLIQAYDERFADTIRGEITGTVALLRALVSENVPCYGLTNFSAEKYPEFARAYDFTRDFKGVVVSGEEGLVKPDLEIFECTVARFGLNPEKTLFIDDRADNVKASETAGFIGHIFTKPEGLEKVLLSLGLLKSPVV